MQHSPHGVFILLCYKMISAELALPLAALGGQDVAAICRSTLDFARRSQREPFFCAAARLALGHDSILSLRCATFRRWRAGGRHRCRVGLFLFRLWFLLFVRHKDRDHAPAFHVRRLIDFRALSERLHQPGEQHLPLFLIGDLPAFENHSRLDLVPLCEKPFRMPHFEVEIMSVGVRMEPQFLEQRHMLMLLLEFVFFRKLILELAKVDDLADRRVGVRDDLDKIGFALPRQTNGCSRTHDAELAAMLINDPYLGDTDFVIGTRAFLLANGCAS